MKFRKSNTLGRPYANGENIIKQGDSGDYLFVIQQGNDALNTG